MPTTNPVFIYIKKIYGNKKNWFRHERAYQERCTNEFIKLTTAGKFMTFPFWI